MSPRFRPWALSPTLLPLLTQPSIHATTSRGPADIAIRLRAVTGILIALLLANAAFNALVWPRFYGRIASDPRARDDSGKPTRFLIVHAVLIALALVLAAASAVAAIFALSTGA